MESIQSDPNLKELWEICEAPEGFLYFPVVFLSLSLQFLDWIIGMYIPSVYWSRDISLMDM